MLHYRRTRFFGFGQQFKFEIKMRGLGCGRRGGAWLRCDKIHFHKPGLLFPDGLLLWRRGCNQVVGFRNRKRCGQRWQITGGRLGGFGGIGYRLRPGFGGQRHSVFWLRKRSCLRFNRVGRVQSNGGFRGGNGGRFGGRRLRGYAGKRLLCGRGRLVYEQKTEAKQQQQTGRGCVPEKRAFLFRFGLARF